MLFNIIRIEETVVFYDEMARFSCKCEKKHLTLHNHSNKLHKYYEP